MPLIVAPPTSVSIFLAVAVQQEGLDHLKGNTAVMMSGAMLAVIGALPPLQRILAKVNKIFAGNTYIFLYLLILLLLNLDTIRSLSLTVFKLVLLLVLVLSLR